MAKIASDEEWEREIREYKEYKEYKEYLYKNGYTNDMFVQPKSQGDTGVASDRVKKYARYSFNANGANNGNELPTFNIKRSPFGTWVPGFDTYGGGTLEYYKGLVNECLANNSWLVWMVHVQSQSIEQV